ncbi:MAG: ArsC family reductase [Hydrogenophilales bacterium 17-61-9]|nr:MAG: ArsC family reductase [Hydrogenophilales bacterium 17-61-9]
MKRHDHLKLFGIPNCTTVKKARAWLAEHTLEATFHDFKKQGVDAAWLSQVVAQTGWQALVNTRGTTWRKLSDAEKAAVTDSSSAIQLMRDQPSVIKRPVLEVEDAYHIGFSEDQYRALFGA